MLAVIDEGDSERVLGDSERVLTVRIPGGDDCYLLENSAATDLAKAARYDVRTPNNDD